MVCPPAPVPLVNHASLRACFVSSACGAHAHLHHNEVHRLLRVDAAVLYAVPRLSMSRLSMFCVSFSCLAAGVSGGEIGHPTGAERHEGRRSRCSIISHFAQSGWRSIAARGDFCFHQPQASYGCGPCSVWLRRTLGCVFRRVHGGVIGPLPAVVCL